MNLSDAVAPNAEADRQVGAVRHIDVSLTKNALVSLEKLRPRSDAARRSWFAAAPRCDQYGLL